MSVPLAELDPEALIARANRHLNGDLQIRPDDPILSLVALNQELMAAYTASFNAALVEAQQEIAAGTRQELDKAAETVGKMIDRTGKHLEEQLTAVGLAWEKQFRESAAHELEKVRQAGTAARIGGYALFIAGIIAAVIELTRLSLWFPGR